MEMEMTMKRMRVLVPVAALVLAACGGGGDEENNAGSAGTGGGDTMSASSETTPMDTAGLAPGTVDTAGMGTNPPTAGGQLVDTAATPGPTDTTQGTTTAP